MSIAIVHEAKVETCTHFCVDCRVRISHHHLKDSVLALGLLLRANLSVTVFCMITLFWSSHDHALRHTI